MFHMDELHMKTSPTSKYQMSKYLNPTTLNAVYHSIQVQSMAIYEVSRQPKEIYVKLLAGIVLITMIQITTEFEIACNNVKHCLNIFFT